MLKSTCMIFMLTLLFLNANAQSGNESQKECIITSGLGIASSTDNIRSLGIDSWLQLDYRVLESISIATEFEYMKYKQPGYYPDRPSGPNEVIVYNNNISLLLKYHFRSKSKLELSIASGWTYCITQSDYFIYENFNNTQHWIRNITSFSEYTIPFLAELVYPMSNKISLQIRAKYNLHPKAGGTFSCGPGIALKL